MVSSQLAIWSAFGGCVLTLLGTALLRALVHRSRGAAYLMLFITVAACGVLLLSGVPETLWPALEGTPWQWVKLAVGPVAGAVALWLLGSWLAASRRDRMVRYIISLGALALAAAGVVVPVLAMVFPERLPGLFWVVALVDAVGVVLATLAASRAAMLGDRLARGMAASCVPLAVAVAGLHVMAADTQGSPWPAEMAVALAAAAYLLTVTWLFSQRASQLRRLREASRAGDGVDALTKLPQAGALFRQAEEALQRSLRLRRECVVIAIKVPNLYTANAEAGYDADHDILIALAARIRQLVGVHDLVGLYHATCFVVVVPAVESAGAVRSHGMRLADEMRQLVRLSGGAGFDVNFRPDVSVGILRVNAHVSDASLALEEAEVIADAARAFDSRVGIREISDDKTTELARYPFPAPARTERPPRESLPSLTRV